MLKTPVVAVNPFPSSLTQALHIVRNQSLSWPHHQDLAAWQISGSDALTWLQGLCALQISPIGSWSKIPLLDRKGIIGFAPLLGQLQGGKFILTIPREQAPKLETYLQSLIFAEEVQIDAISGQLYWNQGPDYQSHPIQSDFCGDWDLCGEGGELHWIANSHRPSTQLCRDLYQRLALESSFELPWHWQGHLFNETALIHGTINPKCYPGQEIVSRIRDRGQSPKSAALIQIPSQETIFSLAQEGKNIFESILCCPINAVDSLALGCLNSKINLPNSKFHADEYSQEIQILCQPHYQSPRKAQQAQKHMEQGLQAFHREEWEIAQEYFTQALANQTRLAEAWEALGICLERQQKIDLAIQSQMNFAKHEPLSVMALANLSRLYMLKGFTDQAENYQSKAQTLALRLEQNHELDLHTQSELDRQAQALDAEKKRKLKLFQQALELDPQDDIALFGLGKAYADAQQFREALPYLQKLLELQPHHSAGWAQFSRAACKSLPKLEALEIVEEGIAIASSQGDLMPLKLMESLRKTL